MSEENDSSKYFGLTKFTDVKGGYSLWIPLGWDQINKEGFKGTAFYPDPSDTATFLYVEKKKLKYRVAQEDLPTLKEGLASGIQSLPDATILEQEQSLTDQMLSLDLKFTFTNEGETSKQWIKVIYSGKSQLALTVQGPVRKCLRSIYRCSLIF